jgi:AcrR family transcriptional regulator
VTPSAEVLELHRAVRRVLTRTGLRGFKVDGVLREAGLSTRALYRHYPDKRMLVLAVMKEDLAAFSAQLESLCAPPSAEPWSRVSAWIGGVLRAAYDPQLAPLSAAYLTNLHELQSEYPEDLPRELARIQAPLLQALSDLADECPHVQPERDAQAIYLLTTHVAIYGLRGSEPARLSDAVDLVTPFVRRALLLEH